MLQDFSGSLAAFSRDVVHRQGPSGSGVFCVRYLYISFVANNSGIMVSMDYCTLRYSNVLEISGSPHCKRECGQMGGFNLFWVDKVEFPMPTPLWDGNKSWGRISMHFSACDSVVN